MLKVISRAQTGVDRGALDAAIENNVQCGGWVPEGRKAEDGTISQHYPVQVLVGAGYKQRTKKNVQDADVTIIIYFGYLSGGTEQTLRFCMNEHKPYLLIDAQEVSPDCAAFRINKFLTSLSGKTLNFAGPRASGESNAYSYALKAVKFFIAMYINNDL